MNDRWGILIWQGIGDHLLYKAALWEFLQGHARHILLDLSLKLLQIQILIFHMLFQTIVFPNKIDQQ